jgi:hypothetical protein
LESDVGQVDEINIDLSSSEIASIPDVDNFIPIPDPPSSETKSGTQEAPQIDATPVRDLSKLKVVRDQFDEFWEEE